MTTRAMHEQTQQRARDERKHKTQRKTQYVIRLTLTSEIYARQNMQWTGRTDDALRFEFVTAAEDYAVNELSLALHEYKVVPV